MENSRRILIIADSFPPVRNSAAQQLADLCVAFGRMNHSVTVITAGDFKGVDLFFGDTVQVFRIRRVAERRKGKVWRALREVAMAVSMMFFVSRSEQILKTRWDIVVWYSPSIFLGIVSGFVLKRCRSTGYLVLRDVFPQWAHEVGVIRRGPAYFFLEMVAQYQYRAAHVIGIQSRGNLRYFSGAIKGKCEVLENWLSPVPPSGVDSPVSGVEQDIREFKKKNSDGRVFIYAGNIGVAQSVSIFLELAVALSHKPNIKIFFVGRGDKFQELKNSAQERKLRNVIFADEIDRAALGRVFDICDVGLLSLSIRHHSHNIPGKFIDYLRSGLPTLAYVNSGNDICEVIRRERVGEACDTGNIGSLIECAERLLGNLEADRGMGDRCRAVHRQYFSSDIAASQIISSVDKKIPVSN